jgi:hypothetical protein
MNWPCTVALAVYSDHLAAVLDIAAAANKARQCRTASVDVQHKAAAVATQVETDQT